MSHRIPKSDFSRPPLGADAPLARSANPRINRQDLRNAQRVRADANGETFRGQVGPSDRNDLYRFTLRNRSQFLATIRRNSEDINTTLLNERGRTLISNITVSGPSSDAIFSPDLAAGVYYLRVFSRTGRTNYRLTLTARRNNAGGNIGDDGGVGGNPVTPTQATRLFRDINPGRGEGSDPTDLTVVGNSLYFAANNGLNDRELFRVTGANGSADQIIVNRTAGVGSDPRDFVNFNNSLFFSATDGVNGRQIFRIANNANQATRVSNINPGADGANPLGLTVFNNILYFAADGVGGRELYRSDGTTQGTFRVADINPGVDSSNPTDFAVVGNLLYFAADNGLNGRELYSTNGTADGTRLVVDLNIGGVGANADSSIPTDLVNLNNVLYFAATGDNALVGRQLWRYDPGAGVNSLRQPVSNILNGAIGANPGTDLSSLRAEGSTAIDATALNDLLQARPNRSAIVAIGNQLYFAATSSLLRRQLYRSNGTPNGTTIAASISTNANSLNPTNLANINGVLYFAGTTELLGTELYRFNPAAAVNALFRRVSDINAGIDDSNPSDFVLFGNNIVFVAETPEFGRELRFFSPNT